ncbi:MAG: hypothetical protein JNK04_18230 [Myxococcales bacterium]|nr:hypothetical protein [Myxococcales bacterium]
MALDDERLVLEVVPAGHVDTLGADATTELERSAVRAHLDPPPSGGEGTTELDRSAFNDTAGTVLPFAPSSEPGRPVASRQADGALPFQPPSERPAARSVPPPLPPLSPPPSRPQLVSTPPKETLRAPLPPPSSPSSAFGLSRLMPQPRPVVSPDLHEPEPAATTEPKNTFRKAFGVKAASDAAVALEGLTAATKAASDAAFAVRTGRPTADASSTSRRAIVDLIALEGGVPARLRRSKRYAPLLVAPAPPRAHKPVDAPVGEPSAEDRGRVDTLRVLSCGTPLGAEDLQAGFDALLDDAHDFDIPLFLVEGQVKPTMDELETLRVAVELAKPLAGSNKRVQAALALASDALARTTPPLPDSAIALYRQLEAATGELALPSRHLADLVDRTLLEARSYRKRTLLGEPRIRAELAQGRQVTPIYLPEAALSKLPLLPTFEIAALVELRPREDVSESSPVGLVAFALGRVLRTRS